MFLRAIATAVAAAHLAGCATLPPHPSTPPEPRIAVNVGDRVHLSTPHPESFLVTRVSDDEVCGRSRCVSRDRVARSIPQADPATTKAGAMGVMLIVALIALGVAASGFGLGGFMALPAGL